MGDSLKFSNNPESNLDPALADLKGISPQAESTAPISPHFTHAFPAILHQLLQSSLVISLLMILFLNGTSHPFHRDLINPLVL